MSAMTTEANPIEGQLDAALSDSVEAAMKLGLKPAELVTRLLDHFQTQKSGRSNSTAEQPFKDAGLKVVLKVVSNCPTHGARLLAVTRI